MTSLAYLPVCIYVPARKGTEPPRPDAADTSIPRPEIRRYGSARNPPSLSSSSTDLGTRRKKKEKKKEREKEKRNWKIAVFP